MMAISKTDKKRQHYWVQPISRKNLDYLKIRSTSLKDTYNITVVPYSIDDSGHTAIYDVIESMIKMIKKWR